MIDAFFRDHSRDASAICRIGWAKLAARVPRGPCNLLYSVESILVMADRGHVQNANGHTTQRCDLRERATEALRSAGQAGGVAGASVADAFMVHR